MSKIDELIEAVNQGDSSLVRALLSRDVALVHARNDRGASALHVAALAGRADMAKLLIEMGADVNCRDERFGATPAGWAIEYLRERGGMLGIELDDFEFAIRRGDAAWVARWIDRFPALRNATDANGVPFRQIAIDAGNQELADLFEENSPE